jgi:cytochrome c oxidase cbb3-type subunit IV
MGLPNLGLDTVRGILLILLMLGFFGIVAWAWSSRRNETFREASQLPLEEDDGEIPAGSGKQETKE